MPFEWCPYEKREHKDAGKRMLCEDRDRWTQRRQSCKDGGRDWSYAATSETMPGAIRSWER